MNYTNGFDMDAILPVLTGRVGWRSENPSGRAIESFHALCTKDNLSEIWPKDNAAGSSFTTYSTNLKKDVIQRCLSSVFNQPEYIEQVLLHNRIENSIDQPFTNNSLFCGVRIKVSEDFQTSVWIKNLSLRFDGAATFNVYLFKQGTSAALKTKSVTVAAGNTSVDLSTDNWILSYGQEQSSVFYIGYFQDDLGSVKALREQVCMNKTIAFNAYYCQAPKLTSTTVDQAHVSFSLIPYGLTAELHSFYDYTQRIVRSANLFDEVIGLSMVYRVLEELVSSTRSNVTERILRDQNTAIELKHYLYGAIPAMGVPKIEGLNDLIRVKIEQVRRAFNPKPKAQTIDVTECC